MNLSRILTNPRHFNWAICDRCSGNGKIVNPNVDGNGLTREDFDEDPDFERDYFAGVYDIACPDCEGGKVREPKPFAQLPYSVKKALVLESYRVEGVREHNAEMEREYRMMGGR